VGELIQEQQQYLDRFSDVLSQAEGARSDVTLTGQDERTLSDQISDRLHRLYDQIIVLQPDHRFDLGRFFETRRKQDIGRSVAQRTRALERCIDGLEQYPELPGASSASGSVMPGDSGVTGRFRMHRLSPTLRSGRTSSSARGVTCQPLQAVPKAGRKEADPGG